MRFSARLEQLPGSPEYCQPLQLRAELPSPRADGRAFGDEVSRRVHGAAVQSREGSPEMVTLVIRSITSPRTRPEGLLGIGREDSTVSPDAEGSLLGRHRSGY